MEDLNNVNEQPVAAQSAVTSKGDKKLFVAGIIIGALVMAIVMVMVVLGITRKYTRKYIEEGTYISGSDSVLDEATVLKIEELQSLIEDKSIYDIDRSELQKGLIDGFLEGTGDKYAQYYTQEEIQEQMTSYSGKFYGIGVVMGPDDNKNVYIHKVYADSPAERAGFREGDIITKVEDQDVTGLSLDEIVAMVRGEKGTAVNVTVYRQSDGQEYVLTPIRDEIKQIVIEYEMLEDTIGYIHIEEWYDTTAEQFEAAKKDLEKQGMKKGLIIDLRSNTGGLVDACVDVLDVCLPESPVVYIENNEGRRISYNADDPEEIKIPIVILTNGYTASASEIFTGAMRDYGRAVTLGTKTYGKGVVQSFFYLYDDSAVKFTTEQYFTPNGTALDGNGIEPDILVELDSEAYYDKENPVDNQLEEAKKYINENY